MHFEWLLDVRHGADYFRRWHRDKANSGGLLVHKASHHFDLVNWWLGAAPGRGVRRRAGCSSTARTARRHGYARDYERAHGDPAAADDPFALHLADNPRLRELYLDAEADDGYQRDRNVFAPGVTIEDDMAVLVRYDTGATMTYHLTAYAPWEGYRDVQRQPGPAGARGGGERLRQPGRRRRGQGRRAARCRGGRRAGLGRL